MCTTYDKNPRRRGSQKRLEEGRRTNCPQMSHTSSKKKSTTWRVRHRKGPKRGQQQHKTERHRVQLMTTYQWNKDEEDLTERKKKKNLYYFSNVDN